MKNGEILDRLTESGVPPDRAGKALSRFINGYADLLVDLDLLDSDPSKNEVRAVLFDRVFTSFVRHWHEDEAFFRQLRQRERIKKQKKLEDSIKNFEFSPPTAGEK